MSELLIYLMFLADSLGAVFLMGMVLCSIVVLALCVYNMNENSPDRWEYTKAIKNAFITGVIFMLMAMFTPSTKQCAIIWALPKIVNNEQVQELPKEALEIIGLKLEDIKDELLNMPKKKEE